jgi:nicotinamide mononucleotide transporter
VIDTLLAAARPILTPAFTLLASPVTWLELLAFVLSLAMVLANLRVKVIGWPLAIVASLLYALLFADSKLYGEAALQIFFVVVSLWGWWQWRRGRGGDGRALTVHTLRPRQRVAVLLATLAAWPALALALMRWTDSDVPWLDALPSVASVAGQLLLGRKLVENWPVWLAVNVLSVGLFAYKGLWLTSVLYAIFALLSAWGWRTWARLTPP